MTNVLWKIAFFSSVGVCFSVINCGPMDLANQSTTVQLNT
ncbi:putative lipoprotein [Synechococcus sp. BIOS-E4-1]|nr:putative lipoprotein [Synechococcus sp. BIOS-E4-1]